jgi:hypothetical protein
MPVRFPKVMINGEACNVNESEKCTKNGRVLIKQSEWTALEQC